MAESTPDLVVLDLQIGNMGGIADVPAPAPRGGRRPAPRVPVLMLLDRQADVFLARRSDADGWVVKPLDAFSLRKAPPRSSRAAAEAAAERALVGDADPA